MALLALLGTLRCLCDSADLWYYLVAGVLPLVVWETATLRRIPVASACAWAAQAVCFSSANPMRLPAAAELSPPVGRWVFIVGAAALVTHLATGARIDVADTRPGPAGSADLSVSC